MAFFSRSLSFDSCFINCFKSRFIFPWPSDSCLLRWQTQCDTVAFSLTFSKKCTNLVLRELECVAVRYMCISLCFICFSSTNSTDGFLLIWTQRSKMISAWRKGISSSCRLWAMNRWDWMFSTTSSRLNWSSLKKVKGESLSSKSEISDAKGAKSTTAFTICRAATFAVGKHPRLNPTRVIYYKGRAAHATTISRSKSMVQADVSFIVELPQPVQSQTKQLTLWNSASADTNRSEEMRSEALPCEQMIVDFGSPSASVSLTTGMLWPWLVMTQY